MSHGATRGPITLTSPCDDQGTTQWSISSNRVLNFEIRANNYAFWGIFGAISPPAYNRAQPVVSSSNTCLHSSGANAFSGLLCELGSSLCVVDSHQTYSLCQGRLTFVGRFDNAKMVHGFCEVVAERWGRWSVLRLEVRPSLGPTFDVVHCSNRGFEIERRMDRRRLRNLQESLDCQNISVSGVSEHWHL